MGSASSNVKTSTAEEVVVIGPIIGNEWPSLGRAYPSEMTDLEQRLLAARSLIRSSRHIVVLTGAGISTASGIPDFRGPDGLWTKDPDAEMLSDFSTYVNRKDIRERAWQSRLHSPTWTAEPNDAHRALVKLEQQGTLDLVITQNIDRLHHAAGLDPERIIEIHGNAFESVCLSCNDRRPIAQALERVAVGEEDPRCLQEVSGNACRGILKSATISFGQSLIANDLARAQRAAEQCDLLVAIGSTLSVQPIAGVVPLAHSQGAAIMIVNGEPTAMDAYAQIVLNGDIVTVLTSLLA